MLPAFSFFLSFLLTFLPSFSFQLFLACSATDGRTVDGLVHWLCTVVCDEERESLSAAAGLPDIEIVAFIYRRTFSESYRTKLL